ncbi:hypothetical protein [Desulfovibrio psychrotolerans]|uniref:Uncharacterized protein n=1 Tax=Desulfovibrio psychrotolerans TaxID=415242 RepID=A0A7J0BS06_9BACT|nr:hypothetical protein [Desulfovibrio psychrotolerans]GFM35962.1 hypothetical protein DSM19430T_06460 [Desulfovibrio psychrotolerans]
MSTNRKAPGSSAKTAQGAKENVRRYFVPFPRESVNRASLCVLPRIVDSAIDRIAAAGWLWDQGASLFVDQDLVKIEVAKEAEQRGWHNE